MTTLYYFDIWCQKCHQTTAAQSTNPDQYFTCPKCGGIARKSKFSDIRLYPRTERQISNWKAKA